MGGSLWELSKWQLCFRWDLSPLTTAVYNKGLSFCLGRNPIPVNRVSAARTAQGVIQVSGYRSLHQNKNCSVVYIDYIDYID